MRVVSISVNGLEQAVEKGFFDWLAKQDADVVCVQDHRMRAYEVEDKNLIPEGYEAYFIDGEKNEHGGVGIYTRHFPKAIMYGFANEQADREGRFLQADFDKVSVASVLAPCALGREEELIGEDDLTVLDHKDEFMEAFGLHMQKTLRKRRQFIFCANLQTAHHVTDASPLYHKHDFSGFLPHERAWLDRLKTESMIEPAVVYGYFPCYSDGNDLVIAWHDGPLTGSERMRLLEARMLGSASGAGFQAPQSGVAVRTACLKGKRHAI